MFEKKVMMEFDIDEGVRTVIDDFLLTFGRELGPFNLKGVVSEGEGRRTLTLELHFSKKVGPEEFAKIVKWLDEYRERNEPPVGASLEYDLWTNKAGGNVTFKVWV